MTKEYKPFGELSRAEQLALFEAWLDGKSIEYKAYTDNSLTTYNWMLLRCGEFSMCTEYRVAVTKPSINWGHVHPDYNWMATDRNGCTYLYTELPVVWESGEVFHTDSGNDCSVTCFVSFKTGTCDWKDSLVQRPASKPPY